MAQPKRKGRAPRPPQLIGWRETVALPDLGIASLKAKVDTGARTSALHAVDIETFERAGQHWARFTVPLAGRVRREARLVDERPIKNTSGEPEMRMVIETALILGSHRYGIEVSLANREKMEFDLILGRTAIRRRGLAVDPGRSFLAGPPIGHRSREPASPVTGEDE